MDAGGTIENDGVELTDTENQVNKSAQDRGLEMRNKHGSELTFRNKTFVLGQLPLLTDFVEDGGRTTCTLLIEGDGRSHPSRFEMRA